MNHSSRSIYAFHVPPSSAPSSASPSDSVVPPTSSDAPPTSSDAPPSKNVAPPTSIQRNETVGLKGGSKSYTTSDTCPSRFTPLPVIRPHMGGIDGGNASLGYPEGHVKTLLTPPTGGVIGGASSSSTETAASSSSTTIHNVYVIITNYIFSSRSLTIYGVL